MVDDIQLDSEDAKALALISTSSLIKELVSRHAYDGHGVLIQTISPEEGTQSMMNTKFAIHCSCEDDFNSLFGCLVKNLEEHGIYLKENEDDES
jgi:hypothetical protein